MATIAINYAPAVLTGTTGVGRVTKQLVTSLLKSTSSDQFLIYSPAPTSLNPSKQVTIVESQWKRPFSTVVVGAENLKFRPDLLLSPDSTVPLLSKTKTVVMIHDLAWRHFPDDYTGKETILLEWTINRALSHARRIVVPTEATKRDIIKCYDVEAKRIRVIPYGRNDIDPGVSKLPKPLDTPYLLAIGTHRRKNLALLVEAFALLKHEQLPHRLVIIGAKNPLDTAFIEAKRALGSLAEQIIETDYLPDFTQVCQYCLHADALLYATKYEGSALPVLDAMSLSVPVICAKIPAIEEIAGSAALLVESQTPLEWAATISRVLHSPKLRHQLVSKGRTRASLYSWEKSAKELLQVCHEVISESS